MQIVITAWLSIPTETLLMPMPEVEDLPTDDALRLGKLRVVFLSFAPFGLTLGAFTPKLSKNHLNFFDCWFFHKKITFKHEQWHAEKK